MAIHGSNQDRKKGELFSVRLFSDTLYAMPSTKSIYFVTVVIQVLK